MKEITVKNIPDKIYKELESKAIRNNHTIDEEVLIQLKNLTEINPDKTKKNSDDWQNISKNIRDSMNFTATEKQISEFKNTGRP